jgi:hypothetical protein
VLAPATPETMRNNLQRSPVKEKPRNVIEKAGLTYTKVSTIPSVNCALGYFLVSSIGQNLHLFL